MATATRRHGERFRGLAPLRQRDFSLLWSAGLISLAGDWMLMVALPILVLQMTGSPIAVSSIVIVELAPRILLGSVAGVFVDRWDRRRALVVANLLQAVAVAPLAYVDSLDRLWVVYACAFAESTIAQFLVPAEGALLPRLIGEEHRMAGNSLNALNNNLARLVGPAAGGLVAAGYGLTGVAIADAVTFLVAAGLVSAIRGSHRADGVDAPDATAAMGAWARLWRELGAGLALVGRDRALRVIFGFLAVTAVGEGVFAVMLIVFVSRVLDGGAMEIGWMMSAQAVGGITGGLVGGWVRPDVSPARLIGLGAVAFGLLDLAIFNYPALYPGIAPAIALFVAVGVPGVIALSALLTTMQNLVEDRFRGRVLGAMSTVQALLGVVGSAAAGLAADHFGVVTILNIQGFAYVASGLLVLVLLGRALASRAQPAPPAAAVT